MTVTFLLVAAAAFVLFGSQEGFRAELRQALQAATGEMYRLFVADFVLNPWFYGVFLGVLALEQLVPAQKDVNSVSRGARTDFLWLTVFLPLQGLLLPLYTVLLRQLFDNYLGFLTVEQAGQWPWVARVVFAILLSDFVLWFSHVVRHKVSALWYFHAVHHSQKQLNFFSDFRLHPLDAVYHFTLAFIPILMFELSLTSVVAIVWIRRWHTNIYHSNIRSNFGILRYLLVTPQSHRIHHSLDPCHFNKNFGLNLSIWDQMFGTQYRNYDEYPETGIADSEFPFEQDPDDSLLVTLGKQLIYPFRAMVR